MFPTKLECTLPNKIATQLLIPFHLGLCTRYLPTTLKTRSGLNSPNEKIYNC